MHTFTDVNAKPYSVKLDAPKIHAVRVKCDGFDLASGDPKQYQRLEDPVLLVNVLWVVCRDQAITAQIGEQQFGESLAGDSIESATAALLGAITDFFPKAKRELLAAVNAQNEKLQKTAHKKAMAKLGDPKLMDRIEQALEQKLDAEIEAILTQSSNAMNAPDSAESQPTDTPSASSS